MQYQVATHLREYFSQELRERGKDYYEGRYVEVEHDTNLSISFSVYGNSRYDVGLKYEETSNSLTGYCTCLHFAAMQICKHLYASLLSLNYTDFETSLMENDLSRLRFFPAKSYHFEAVEKNDEELKKDRFVAKLKGLKQEEQRQQWEKKFKKISYVIDDLDTFYSEGSLEIKLLYQTRLRIGEWGNPKILNIKRPDIERLVVPEDRDAISYLMSVKMTESKLKSRSQSFNIRKEDIPRVLEILIKTKRLYWHGQEGRFLVENYYKDKANIYFNIIDNFADKKWVVRPCVKIGNEIINTFEKKYKKCIELGVIPYSKNIYSIETNSLGPLLHHDSEREISFDYNEKERLQSFIKEYLPNESYTLPSNLDLSVEYQTPTPVFKVQIIEYKEMSQIVGELYFDYDGEMRKAEDTIFVGDTKFEKSVYDFIRNLEGIQFFYENNNENEFLIDKDKFIEIVSDLKDNEIDVFAAGRKVTTPVTSKVSVEASGLDWFEIKGKIKFKTVEIGLPEILRGKYKHNLIPLSNGEMGILPKDWLRKQVSLSEVAQVDGEKVVIHRGQAVIIDHLFFDHERETDDVFKNFITHIKDFEKVEEIVESSNFKGELRKYQREGLTWLNFLKDLRLGGCLADDMGLGKTIQVLANLDHHHKKSTGRSLIVVPRSLLFNWKNEAQKFVPHLKVGLYDGNPNERTKIIEDLSYDILIATYGIVRRDIIDLKEYDFQYLILDEAQNIKNKNSQISKSVCLLKGLHKLALTGTPVENSIEDLISIFRFLSPGMFTRNQVVSDKKDNTNVLKSLRPFILRRTKEEVLKDLPEKTEKIIYCELNGAHKETYNELKDYYKKKLNQKIKKSGLTKNKVHVLEALLRLRQAANHPAMVNEDNYNFPSSKVELLLANIRRVQKAGRKIIVFSQFVKFLSLIKTELEKEGLSYEYLDGSSRSREDIVRRFKTSSRTNLFLISIKAGGVGLNLTEADYCFILDPWWNPAVEAQAIDRIHRIGQEKKVFAYKMIAKGTVEEKVVELQLKKKDISEDVLSADGSFIKNITQDDLAYILT